MVASATTRPWACQVAAMGQGRLLEAGGEGCCCGLTLASETCNFTGLYGVFS